jgi:predicted dinucleotide-binding enzyme
MGYKTFVSMNIAVIGEGAIAEKYAAGFAVAGHNVFMARKEGKNREFNPILKSFPQIHFCSIEDAASIGDLVVMATEPADVREVSYWLGDVRRKVIIDATSNVHTANNEPLKTVCAIKAITGSPHIVKAFHTMGYEQLLKPVFKSQQVEMILVGDSKKAKEIAKILAIELGIYKCYDFGGGEAIVLFNDLTASLRRQYALQLSMPALVTKETNNNKSFRK